MEHLQIKKMKLLNYDTFCRRLDTEEKKITELKDKWGESIWDEAQRKQNSLSKFRFFFFGIKFCLHFLFSRIDIPIVL